MISSPFTAFLRGPQGHAPTTHNKKGRQSKIWSGRGDRHVQTPDCPAKLGNLLNFRLRRADGPYILLVHQC